jgi:curved DNA-binding protein CbpA
MDPTTLDEIQRFLTIVSQPDLFQYLDVDADAEKSDIEFALQRRRSWAQGQQANPKYRNEALWLIKNIQLVQKTLILDRAAYVQHMLDRLEAGLDAEPEAEAPKDHYARLGAAPGDDFPTLERAYRARYRWARNLQDTDESSRIYADLDEAWRVLKDPHHRAEYDAEYGFPEPSTAPSAAPSDAEHQGFLPPPSPPAAEAEAEITPDAPAPADAASELAAEPTPDMEEPAFEIDDPEAESADADPDSPSPFAGADDDSPLGGADDEALDMPGGERSGDDSASEDPKDGVRRGTFTAMDSEMELGPAGDTKAPLDDPESPMLDIGDIDDVAKPVLQVMGDKHLRIRTGKQPFPVHVMVKNNGSGQMSGSVSCDLDWVTVSPTFLNPTRQEHKIEILVDPAKMPGNAAQAKVRIETDHGESEIITVDALKHVVSPVLIIVAALALLGITGIVGGVYVSGVLGTAPVTPTRTIFSVQVDPPAGEVYIDDKLVGNQGTLSLVDAFPLDEPFQVRVELDGFEPWAKEVSVPFGQQIRVEADLILRDPMNFEIKPTMRAAEIDPKTVSHRLEQREGSYKSCFTRNLQTETPYVASITAKCIVSSRGYVAAVEYRGANFKSRPVEVCLSRQLRSLKFPVIPTDYAMFEQTFRARVGPAKMADAATQSTDEP